MSGHRTRAVAALALPSTYACCSALCCRPVGCLLTVWKHERERKHGHEQRSCLLTLEGTAGGGVRQSP
jgi:hypothetical protein